MMAIAFLLGLMGCLIYRWGWEQGLRDASSSILGLAAMDIGVEQQEDFQQ